MICQATYDSLDAIPEALRDEFEQKGSKWQLKDSAIPGVGPLFNKALAANSEKQLGQLETKKSRIRELEEELSTKNDRLAAIDSPGSQVLSGDDAKNWSEYTKLGTPSEIKTKLAEHAVQLAKITEFETGAAVTKAVDSLKDQINPEVLTDWLTSKEGEGVEVFVKTVEQTDAKNNKVQVEVPWVKIEKKGDDGKVKVSEQELLTFAKETLPDWKYKALTTVDGDTKAKPKTVTQPVSGVKLPDLGSTQKTPSPDEKKRPVDTFNQQRDSKPNPFAKTAVPGIGAGGGVGTAR